MVQNILKPAASNSVVILDFIAYCYTLLFWKEGRKYRHYIFHSPPAFEKISHSPAVLVVQNIEVFYPRLTLLTGFSYFLYTIMKKWRNMLFP